VIAKAALKNLGSFEAIQGLFGSPAIAFPLPCEKILKPDRENRSNNINQILAKCSNPGGMDGFIGRPGAPGLIKTFALAANPAIREDNPSITLIDEPAASPAARAALAQQPVAFLLLASDHRKNENLV